MKLRPKVIELVNFLKNNEVEVWVVSASPEIFVSAALKYYKINAKVIGLRNIIVDDKITLELKKPLSIITGKVDCIKEFINSRHTPLLGVGDSINDLPMLEYCKIKIVVDRQNALAEKAKQNNWFLI
jgi:phosphoserine phosphatase